MPDQQRDQKRRQILESLHCTAPTGPRQEGLAASDELLIGEFYNRRVCQRFRGRLAAQGIASSVRSDRIKVQVSVRHADRERSFALLAEHRKQHPDERPTGIRRDFDLTLLGGLLGACAGVVMLTVRQHGTLWAVGWAGWVVSGLCLGAVFDRGRRNCLYYGRLQFSLAEILILTAVVGVLIAFWSYLRSALPAAGI